MAKWHRGNDIEWHPDHPDWPPPVLAIISFFEPRLVAEVVYERITELYEIKRWEEV